jgi:hypothetical protein
VIDQTSILPPEQESNVASDATSTEITITPSYTTGDGKEVRITCTIVDLEHASPVFDAFRIYATTTNSKSDPTDEIFNVMKPRLQAHINQLRTFAKIYMKTKRRFTDKILNHTEDILINMFDVDNPLFFEPGDDFQREAFYIKNFMSSKKAGLNYAALGVPVEQIEKHMLETSEKLLYVDVEIMPFNPFERGTFEWSYQPRDKEKPREKVTSIYYIDEGAIPDKVFHTTRIYIRDSPDWDTTQQRMYPQEVDTLRRYVQQHPVKVTFLVHMMFTVRDQFVHAYFFSAKYKDAKIILTEDEIHQKVEESSKK